VPEAGSDGASVAKPTPGNALDEKSESTLLATARWVAATFS